VHQIIVWMVMTFFCVILFISMVFGTNDSFERRNNKQNLNLAGREIVNHVYNNNDNKLIINETEYVASLNNLIKGDNFCGSIFVYKNYVCYINRNLEKSNIVYFNEISDVSVIDKINFLLNDLIKDDLLISKIEIGSLEKEMVYNSVFNSIDGVTVFLVMRTKKYYTVSGYSLS